MMQHNQVRIHKSRTLNIVIVIVPIKLSSDHLVYVSKSWQAESLWLSQGLQLSLVSTGDAVYLNCHLSVHSWSFWVLSYTFCLCSSTQFWCSLQPYSPFACLFISRSSPTGIFSSSSEASLNSLKYIWTPWNTLLSLSLFCSHLFFLS